MSFDEDVAKSLNEIIGSRGRLLTLKAIASTDDWQDCRDVGMKVRQLSHHGTNYIFELAHNYPSMLELAPDKSKIRIRPEVARKVRKMIKSAIVD